MVKKSPGLEVGHSVQMLKKPGRLGVVIASVGHKMWLVRMNDSNEELKLSSNQVRSMERKDQVDIMNGKYIA
jgi:hypothetical protein